MVEMSATTTSASSSCSYIGTSITPEWTISSARTHVTPAASTAGLMIVR